MVSSWSYSLSIIIAYVQHIMVGSVHVTSALAEMMSSGEGSRCTCLSFQEESV